MQLLVHHSTDAHLLLRLCSELRLGSWGQIDDDHSHVVSATAIYGCPGEHCGSHPCRVLQVCAAPPSAHGKVLQAACSCWFRAMVLRLQLRLAWREEPRCRARVRHFLASVHASWLLITSQSPSDAMIRSSSSPCRLIMVTCEACQGMVIWCAAPARRGVRGSTWLVLKTHLWLGNHIWPETVVTDGARHCKQSHHTDPIPEKDLPASRLHPGLQSDG